MLPKGKARQGSIDGCGNWAGIMVKSTGKPKWAAQIASVLSALVAIVCPLCIPALGAFLASVGLGFAVSITFLQPFLIMLLLLSLASLAWSARLHKQWWILVVGAIGAFGIYAGRYIWFSQLLMYTGAFLLIGTSLVNFKLKVSCECQ